MADPEYVRIHALIERVLLLLDEDNASPGDALHVAAHLTHFAMKTLNPAEMWPALQGYFNAIAQGLK